MSKPTREKLLEAALKQFSRHGFYGTSIRQIAEEVGLTKQALLHHFQTKEKLYGAVLLRVARILFRGVREAAEGGGTELEKLEAICDYLSSWLTLDPDAPGLVMRELLDNQERAVQAENWVMIPMMELLVGLVESGQKKGLFQPVQPLLFIYHLLGAQHYFLISLPTLRKLSRSEEEYEALLASHAEELKGLLRARLIKP